MKDTLTINGKLYVHTPDVKEDRLSGWIRREFLSRKVYTAISEQKHSDDDTRMIQINEGEIIVSESDVRKAVRGKCHGDNEEIIIKSLFKKDGV